MYQNIFELPPEVTNSLNADDCEYWMQTYNSISPNTKEDVRAAKKKAWAACKERPSSFSFEIIASTDTVDMYDEIIDFDSLKASMDEFIDSGGNVQNDHHDYRVACIWDWKPCKVKDQKGNEVNGLIVLGNIFGGYVGKKIRHSFLNGGMNKMSIAGEAPEKIYQCDEKGCYTRRKVKQLLEISLTKSPVNKMCTMIWSHEADDDSIAKSDSYMFGVNEYTIHKSETECPIMSLKRSLCAIGYDAHAREDGVHIPMDFDEFVDSESIFRSHGLDIDYHDGYANVKRSLEDHLKGIYPELEERQKKLFDETNNSNNPYIIKLHDDWYNYPSLKTDKDRKAFLDKMQSNIYDAKLQAYKDIEAKKRYRNNTAI